MIDEEKSVGAGWIRGDPPPAHQSAAPSAPHSYTMISPVIIIDEPEVILVKRKQYDPFKRKMTIRESSKESCLHETCPGRCFMCIIEAICSLIYEILSLVGFLLVCILKLLTAIFTFLSFVICCCCIYDKRHPFRIKLRNQQLDTIETTLENHNILCISLVDTLVFLSKTKPKNMKSEKIKFENVRGETIKLYLVTRPHLQNFLLTVCLPDSQVFQNRDLLQTQLRPHSTGRIHHRQELPRVEGAL